MDVKLAYTNTAKSPLSRPGALQVAATSCPLSCDSNIIGAGDDDREAFPKDIRAVPGVGIEDLDGETTQIRCRNARER
ncbi:hypothetical protein CGLO_10864 [Colletotrichum gloeosporioides Cg-14]|uniref:Uncharacterized protein n=1 Tax=Colletotrichum gloeosporioides (strain Cg-14) TaxID=1237896 RepID=T0K9N8_COLGC|nr:hypothetical protein CGLO_10864 [Colletotrichum gloeosporioides Cg-14]